MAFEIDAQTLQDLSVNRNDEQQTIIALFKPVTLGGMVRLKEYIDNPLTNIGAISRRLDVIKSLSLAKHSVTLNKEHVDFIEYYLKQPARGHTVSKLSALKHWLKENGEYYIVQRGAELLLKLLLASSSTYSGESDTFLKDTTAQINHVVELIDADLIGKLNADKKLDTLDVEKLDHLFRYAKHSEIKAILNAIYDLDVYQAVAASATQLNLCYPDLVNSDKPLLVLDGFFHPFIKDPVTNDIHFDAGANICFVTGANMAGKSTVLKSIGICVFLAHVGFPVPAKSMRASIFNGLFTTINLSDNIALGHSHFYREVLRIKEVAIKVGSVKKLLIIFDELFRGTNVKDAYDASLAIIKAFAEVKGSVFIVSTHITEVAAELNSIDNIFFNCLTTTMVNDKAIYNYKLRPGISDEKLGMKIIEDEGLLDIIRRQAGK